MTNDGFVITIALPQSIPSEQEVELYTGSVEPFLQKLLDDGYLTKQELAAYIIFVSQFAQLSGFLLDEFLNQYRHATDPPATSRLVIPG